MSESAMNVLSTSDLTLSGPAQAKMAELVQQVEDDIKECGYTLRLEVAAVSVLE